MTTRNDAPEIISRSNDLFFNYFHDGHRHIVCLPKDCLIHQLQSGPTPPEREETFRLHWPTLRPLLDAKLLSGDAGLVYLSAEDLLGVRIEPRAQA